MTDWAGVAGTVDPFDAETKCAISLCRQLMAEYVAWGGKIKSGEVTNMMYGEVIDFVNFRLETADSCIALIQSGKVADALGLCRSLLENYLLLILMCRSRKLFRIEDATSKSDSQFKKYVKEQQDKLAERRAAGETPACIAVQSYPRFGKRVMYVFEGLKDRDDPELMTSLHYFVFREFRPEEMRLDHGAYFSYYPTNAESLHEGKKYRAELEGQHRYFLSYDALMHNLELNDLLDGRAKARLQAHYTFLGKFLHPTHNAARELHERSNHYDGKPAVGLPRRYTKAAVLLASLYVCYCLAGILDEIAGLHEGAPSKYMADPGTEELRSLTASVPVRFPYFWFLFNDPPLYDKFNYATYHVSDDDLKRYGGYANVPSDLVPSNQHIYDHFVEALKFRSNAKCGDYKSPLSPA